MNNELITTDIYNTKAHLVNRIRECALTKEDFPETSEPSFISFCDHVWKVGPVARYKLQGLWCHSSQFYRRWREPPSVKTPAELAYQVYFFGLTTDEAFYILIAWMRHHGRYPNHSERIQIFEMVCLKRVEADEGLKEQYRRRIQKRRLKRRQQRKDRMKYGPAITKQKIGRPFEIGPECLHNRILETLKLSGRLTPAEISKQLGATVSAVTSQLYRMKHAGILESPARGSYQLPPGNDQSTMTA